MSRLKRKLGTASENQTSLFDAIEEINPQKFAEANFQPETKPLGVRIKEAISEAMRSSGLKRYEIAGRMSEHLGVEITESMLNSYSAESKEGYRLPAEYYPTFCKVTQDYTILEILVSASGGRMVKSDEIYLLELGKVKQAQRSLQRKESQLQKEWERTRGGR